MKKIKNKNLNKIKFNDKITKVLTESLNFLLKGTKITNPICYIVVLFLPILFLFLGSVLVIVRFLKILFRKQVIFIYYRRRRYKYYRKRRRFYSPYYNNRYRDYDYFDPRRAYYSKSERILDRLERKEAKFKLRELRTYEKQWRKERFNKFKSRVKTLFTSRKKKAKQLEELRLYFKPLGNTENKGD